LFCSFWASRNCDSIQWRFIVSKFQKERESLPTLWKGRKCLERTSPGVNFINMMALNFYFTNNTTPTLLEVTPNFCDVRSMLCASKVSVNPLAQTLFIEECWWNWHLKSISSTFYSHVFCTKFWRQNYKAVFWVWIFWRKMC